MSKKRYQLTQEQRKLERRQKLRTKATLHIYKNMFQKTKKELLDVKKESLSEKLDQHNLKEHERVAIDEILNAANVSNSKRRRYSDQWLTLSLLLHMRSPATYRFLGENNILALPCTWSIRRYVLSQ